MGSDTAEQMLGLREIWIQIFSPSFTRRFILAKSLHLFKLQLSHQYNGDKNIPDNFW